MTLQDYYPTTVGKQVSWLESLARELPQVTGMPRLKPEELADIVADARWLAYLLGPWRTSVTNLTKSMAPYLKSAQMGQGSDPLSLLTLNLPPLPEGVVPRPPGGLKRIFRYVQIIKRSEGYTDVIGRRLSILTITDASEHEVPTFKARVKHGAENQIVAFRFSKHGHAGIYAESRRGGGDWEKLGIHLGSVFEDKRPLLVPGQPELREYRIRFFDDSSATGEWSAVVTLLVGP